MSRPDPRAAKPSRRADPTRRAVLAASGAAGVLLTVGGAPALPEDVPVRPTPGLSDRPASGTDPERRRRTLARFKARLAKAGLNEKVRAAWLFSAADLDTGLRGIVGTAAATIDRAERVGFETNAGLRLLPGGDGLELQVQATDLVAADCHIGLMLLDPAEAGTAPSLAAGARGSDDVLSIDPRGRARGVPVISCASRPVEVGTGLDTDGSGFLIVTRRNAERIEAYRNGVLVAAVTAPIEPLPPRAMRILPFHDRDPSGSPSSRVAFVTLGAGLSGKEASAYDAIVRSTVDTIRHGEILSYDTAEGPAVVEADLVVYGTTPSGIVAAYEAARQNLRCVIIGGWRDRAIGGMMSGGLGFSDFLSMDALGGLPAAVLDRIAGFSGRSDDHFEPRYAGFAFAAMLDPGRSGGQDVPIFWSDGVEGVSVRDGRIVALSTADGRRVSGKVFIDCSYEGDLMARAGVVYKVGREAAAVGLESLNGYRGLATSALGGNHQFELPRWKFFGLTGPRTFGHIDPFIVPGDPSSGLLPAIGTRDAAIGIGDADVAAFRNGTVIEPSRSRPKTQAYTFRLTATDAPDRRADLPSEPPPGYESSRYEALLRWIAAAQHDGRPLALADIVFINQPALGPGVYDINAWGGFSTDPFGLSWGYPEADYGERERLWKAHETYQRGLFWTLQHSRDERIPPSLRQEANRWGLDTAHYLDPHRGDAVFWPPQLYVRESRRMVGDLVWDANDLAERRAPRSTKTVAVASYAMDSHHVQSLADRSTGRWRIWNEGNFEDDRTGGRDHVAALPYEIIVPRREDCSNLLVTFCVSATHAAFGAIRMEFTAMALGQAAGAAAALFVETSVSMIQDVDYDALRDRLARSSVLFGERPAVLPTTNGS